MSSARIDGNKHLPVMCTVHTFTDDAIVILPEVTSNHPLPSVAKSYTYLQVISHREIHVSITGPIAAITLSDEQLADICMALHVIAWVPQWKCEGLGLTPMGPQLEQSTESASI